MGPAQHAYHQIDDVAAEFEHDPAAIIGQSRAACRRDDFAHHGMDFVRLAEPSAFEQIAQQYDRRIVSIHIAHLYDQVLAGRRVENPPILRQRLSGRFVQMHVFAGGDARLGGGKRIANACFDQHGLDARRVEQRIQRHPRQVAIGISLFGAAPQLGIGLDDSDDFVVGRSTKDRQLAGVCVPHADLPDLDLPRRCGSSGGRRSGSGDQRTGQRRAELLEYVSTVWHGADSL